MAPLGTNHDLTLVLTLALAMGVMGFDQGSAGCLLPFIKPAPPHTNVQVGIVPSGYWIAFALASYGVGILVGARAFVRNCLVRVLAAFALGSFLSAFVGGVQSLLPARAVMGLLAGALSTLVQTVLGLSSPPKRVGTNMGADVKALPQFICRYQTL
jgi:MFS family permease